MVFPPIERSTRVLCLGFPDTTSFAEPVARSNVSPQTFRCDSWQDHFFRHGVFRCKTSKTEYFLKSFDWEVLEVPKFLFFFIFTIKIMSDWPKPCTEMDARASEHMCKDCFPTCAPKSRRIDTRASCPAAAAVCSMPSVLGSAPEENEEITVYVSTKIGIRMLNQVVDANLRPTKKLKTLST